jgi:hypothetical protein
MRKDFRVDTPTGAMSDIFESRRDQVEGYVKGIPEQQGQLGAVFVINGKIAGLDLFEHSEIFAGISAKLVRSYAMDAIRQPADLAEVASSEVVVAFLRQIEGAKTRNYPAIGEGEDLRIEGSELLGGGLHARQRLLHLCVFAADAQDSERDERISSLRARRAAWRHRQ